MNKIQIITATNGEEMVVLPKADYDAMLAALDRDAEDGDDVAIYDARKAELEGMRNLPADVTMAMLRGDHRIKALRQWRRMTQQKLAEETATSQGFISDIESGRREPNETTAARIAEALGVDVEWIKG